MQPSESAGLGLIGDIRINLHTLWAPTVSGKENSYWKAARRKPEITSVIPAVVPGSFSACAFPTRPVTDSAFPLRISADRLLFCCSSTILL